MAHLFIGANIRTPRRAAIAVLDVKVKPPSAVASRTLTAPRGDGVWPPCSFGAR
jgi:hypothetical protein